MASNTGTENRPPQPPPVHREQLVVQLASKELLQAVVGVLEFGLAGVGPQGMAGDLGVEAAGVLIRMSALADAQVSKCSGVCW